MKKLILLVLICGPVLASAQTKTTDALQKKFSDSFTLFFYKNTLKMLNQTDNKEFDEMIKNIEKMKFMIIDKEKKAFGPADYKSLKKSYASETYEEIITSRHEGRNFDVLLKDKKGSSLGTVVLVNDSTNLYILDILGTIDVRQAMKLFSAVDDNTEITNKIKSFMENGPSKKHGKKLTIN